MSIKASLVAKIVTTLEDGDLIVGTGYPIRNNVVITAFHVIPDIEQFHKTKVKWPKVINGDDEPWSSEIKSVLYSDKDFDIAIVECETPETVTKVDVSLLPPSSSDHWDSFGYPDAGVDEVKQVRKKVPAGGNYFVSSDEDHELHLRVYGDAAETKLWRGMSGAPVFTANTNQLTAIISQVPNNENPDFKDRIYATSLAFLRTKKIDALEKALECKDSDNEYHNQQKKALLDELSETQENKIDWYQELSQKYTASGSTSPANLMSAIAQSFAEAPVACVETLRVASERYMSATNRISCELLLLRTLALKTHQDQWTGEQLHDFKIRTRLLCELRLASRYDVTPQLKRLEKGEVVGEYAIEDHAAKEVGFNDDQNAEQQAKTIAYYLYRRWDDEYDLDEMTEEDWDGVCEELSTRRKGIKPELVRFEVNARKDKNHPLTSNDVRQALYQYLPDLPIVLFGTGVETHETLLRTQVKVFYEKLDNA